MNETLEVINALNARLDSFRAELAEDITESRRELIASITTLEQRLMDKIQDDQKDHRIMKRALAGLATLVFVSIGASGGGAKLLSVLEHLI